MLKRKLSAVVSEILTSEPENSSGEKIEKKVRFQQNESAEEVIANDQQLKRQQRSAHQICCMFHPNNKCLMLDLLVGKRISACRERVHENTYCCHEYSSLHKNREITCTLCQNRLQQISANEVTN